MGARQMKTQERLVGSDELPMVHEAIIVVSNHELARAVGEYVEKKYGVEPLNVVFEMKRKSWGSDKADIAAGVEVRKNNGQG
jgi:hypothetical protein